jgi:hypothetical protein
LSIECTTVTANDPGVVTFIGTIRHYLGDPCDSNTDYVVSRHILVGDGGFLATLYRDPDEPIVGGVYIGSAVSINRTGTIAFSGSICTSVIEDCFEGDCFRYCDDYSPAIFATLGGPNKVIGGGDVLFGSQVQSLSIARESLNDQGQIAFTANLADGRHGVYVATPIK